MAMEKKEPKDTSVSVKDILSKESKSKKTGDPTKSDSKKSRKPRFKHTHIEHHDDGSHTIRHTPAGGGDEVTYAKPDLDGVYDGLEENVGEPNADEQQVPSSPDEGGSAPPSPEPGPQGA